MSGKRKDNIMTLSTQKFWDCWTMLHPGKAWFCVSTAWIRWTTHTVTVTFRDNGNKIGIVLYSYYTTITGWGALLKYTRFRQITRSKSWIFTLGRLLWGHYLGRCFERFTFKQEDAPCGSDVRSPCDLAAAPPPLPPPPPQRRRF